MSGYKLATALLACALLALVAAVIVGLLKWIETRKIATALLAGGTAFIGVATASVTITAAVVSVDV